LCDTGDEAPEPLPDSTTITTKVPTTVHGHPTQVPTIEVVPAGATPDGTASPPHHPHHTHKALGDGSHLLPPMPLVISAAVAAGVASAGYLTTAEVL
jgi:hypothetical protein